MAIFHLNVSVTGRSDGASSVAGAAYISRSRMVDERTGVAYDYTRCHRHERLVADLGVSLPDAAPARWRDRSTLWNEVEAAERGARAQLCRRIELALPVELDDGTRLKLSRRIVRYYTAQGMVVDACIHDALDGSNPHLHLLMPLRPCNEDGFTPKSANEYLVRDGAGEERWATAAELMELNADGGAWSKVYRYRRDGERLELTAHEAGKLGDCERIGKVPVQRTRYLVDWNERGKAEEWRAAVAAMENDALAEAGSDARVDHRSFSRRGIDRIPTEHEGPAACAVERRARRRAERDGRVYRPVTARRIRNERVRRRNLLFDTLLRELLFALKVSAKRDIRHEFGVPYLGRTPQRHRGGAARQRGGVGRQFGF